MARLYPLRFIACAAPAFLLAPASAHAQTPIGGAAVIVKDVRGETAGRRARMNVGDRVFPRQTVQTASESMAKLVFVDDANMTIGPDSRARLDAFVFDPNGAAKSVAFSATKGAFRFASGKSPSEAYKVTTPHAHIGVRGTIYDVRVQNGRTLVVLQEGSVNVCLRNSARCRELNQRGQSLIVTENDIAGPISPANKPWDFGALCAGRAADLCGATQFAEVPAPTRRAQAAPPRRVVRAQKPRPRPHRPVRTVIVEEAPFQEPVYAGRPAPFVVGVGVVAPPRGGRPRPGPGWRPPGAKPPPTGGRRPVEPRRPREPGAPRAALLDIASPPAPSSARNEQAGGSG